MKRIFSLLSLSAVLSLSGCTLYSPSASSSDDLSSSSSSSKYSFSLPSSSSSSGEVALPSSVEFEDFWDYGNALRFSLSFSSASLYALSHYGSTDSQKWGDVYFPCTVTLNSKGQDYVFDEVGARMKGNLSRREICDMDGNITASCHLKLSFKTTFDDDIYSDFDAFKPFLHDWSADATGLATRKKRTLFGMEKLDLKYLPRNSNNAISQEIYVYDCFRSSGLLASHAKWAEVTLATPASQKSYGYEVIEDIDKVFLKRHFDKDEAKGDLYKCVWGTDCDGRWSGSDFAPEGAVAINATAGTLASGSRIAKGRIGVEDNFNYYHPNYQLKTNDDGENSDFGTMANFINTLWNIRYRKCGQNVLESLLDVPEFLKFEALSYLFGNFDDQRNNANNFYLYFRPSDGKAIYIPYDWDWALGANDAAGKYKMATTTPLQTTGFIGDVTANIYWVTFFASSGLAYSQAEYIGRYLAEMMAGLDAAYLDPAKYQTLAARAPAMLGTGDVDSVSRYMNAKKQTIAQALD